MDDVYIRLDVFGKSHRCTEVSLPKKFRHPLMFLYGDGIMDYDFVSVERFDKR